MIPEQDHAPVPMESPYRGLMPYTESDTRYFFGRERDTLNIAANLEIAPLTLFYGPSGVGKSSVLRAGVMERLQTHARRALRSEGRAGGIPIYFSAWQSAPLEGLKAAVRAGIAAVLGTAAVVIEPGTPETLAVFLRRLTTAYDSDLLIILDQFEEYFLYHPPAEEGDSFAQQWIQVVNSSDVRVNFLVSLRDDGLAKVDRFKAEIPALFENRLALRYLDSEDATRAIEAPLAAYNRDYGTTYTIEPHLTTQLLQEMTERRVSWVLHGAGEEARSGPIETAYLQVVLLRLWSEAQAQGATSLRLATLQALGGSETIVRNYLDEAMATLEAFEPPQIQDLARFKAISATFFDRLVTASGSKIALSRTDLESYARQAHATPEEIAEVVRQLQVKRILRAVSTPTGITHYEIFHDVLAQAVLEWHGVYTRQQTQILEQAQRAAEAADLLEQERLAREKVEIRADEASKRAVLEARNNQRLRWLLAVMALLVLVSFYLFYAAQQAQTEATDAQNSAAQAQATADVAGTVAVQSQGEADRAAIQVTRATEALVSAEADIQRQTASLLGSQSLQLLRDQEIASAYAHVLASYAITETAEGYDAALGLTTEEYYLPRLRLAYSTSPEQTIEGAAWDPGFTAVVAWGTASYARVWDAATGQHRFDLDHGRPVNGTTWNRMGTRLLTWGRDSRTQLWDSATGRLLRTMAGAAMSDGVQTALWNQDERLLLTQGTGHAYLWDMTTTEQAPAPLVELQHDQVSGAGWNRSGDRVATWGEDGTVRLWTPTLSGTLTLPVPLVLTHTGPVWGVAWHPDDRAVAVWGDFDEVVIWDTTSTPATRRSTYPLEPDTPIAKLEWRPDGTLLFVRFGLTSSASQVIDPATEIASELDTVLPFQRVAGDIEARLIEGKWDPTGRRIWGGQKAPNGELFIVVAPLAQGASLEVYPVPAGLRNLIGLEGWHGSPDGTGLVAWGPGSFVWIRVDATKQYFLRHHDPTTTIINVQQDEDASRLLTVSQNEGVYLWQLQRVGRTEATLATNYLIDSPAPVVNYEQMAVDVTEQFVVVYGDEHWSVYDRTSNRPVAVASGEEAESVEWHPSKPILLVWDRANELLVQYDAENRKVIATLPFRNGTQVVYSPDGNWISALMRDGRVRLWSATGEPVSQGSGPSDSWRLTWHPSSQQYLVWHQDTCAPDLFSIGSPTTHLFEPLEGRVCRVAGAVWNRDGSALLAWSEQGEAVLYTPQGSKQVLFSNARVVDGGWNAAGSEFFTRQAGELVVRWRVTEAGTIPVSETLPFPAVATGAVWSGADLLVWDAQGTAYRYAPMSTPPGGPIPQEFRHGDVLAGATVSPDGRYVATWDVDRLSRRSAMTLWNVATGVPLFQETFVNPINGVAFGNQRADLFVWGTDNPQAATNLELGQREALAVGYHLDATTITRLLCRQAPAFVNTVIAASLPFQSLGVTDTGCSSTP